MASSADVFAKLYSEVPNYNFVADQLEPLPENSTYKSHIEGGTFIVTGSNTGLGFEAANALVATGAAKVILAVRTQSKGDEAVKKIEEKTGVKGTTEVWTLDMSSYDSILAFGKRVQGLDRLDGISENAAVAHDSWTTADKGMETTLVVNVLGTLLLAALVAPVLQKTAKALGRTTTLSIVGSGVAFQTDARDEVAEAVKSGKDIIDFFNDKSRGVPSRYPVSKLILLHAIRYYSKQHPVSETGVAVNFVNPGLCITELDRNVSPEAQANLGKFREQIGRTAEVGARTLVHGIVGGDETHGKYTSENVVKDQYTPEFIKGEEGQKVEKLVWESVKKHINEISPGAL